MTVAKRFTAMRAQKDGKNRTCSRCTFDLEKTPVVIEDVLYYRQAEPGAAHLAGARRMPSP